MLTVIDKVEEKMAVLELLVRHAKESVEVSLVVFIEIFILYMGLEDT